MFGRKTKRIKELESELEFVKFSYNEDRKKLLSENLALKSERDNLVIENNKLRSKMPKHGANGQFIRK